MIKANNNNNYENEKWEPIENPDILKRKPEEWAKIYNVKVLNPLPNELWSEYEWAYHFQNFSYFPANQDFERTAEMELRAIQLRRDLFLGADMGEREVLKEKYIETQWVKSKLRMF